VIEGGDDAVARVWGRLEDSLPRGEKAGDRPFDVVWDADRPLDLKKPDYKEMHATHMLKGKGTHRGQRGRLRRARRRTPHWSWSTRRGMDGTERVREHALGGRRPHVPDAARDRRRACCRAEVRAHSGRRRGAAKRQVVRRERRRRGRGRRRRRAHRLLFEHRETRVLKGKRWE